MSQSGTSVLFNWHMRRHNHLTAFTLIELMIVVIIIGCLASIAAPMISNMRSRAICTEAVTAIGTIKSALRAYYVEYNTYPYIEAEYLSDKPDIMKALGLTSDSLQGTYFSSNCYFLNLDPSLGDHIAIYATPDPTRWDAGSPNTAPRANEIQKISTGYIVMYIQNGALKQFDFPESGYPHDDGP